MRLGNYEWEPEADLIAEGAFAEVFRARDTNTAGRTVALKIYKEAVAKGSSGSSGQKKYTLEQEFHNVDGLSHTNIIAYYGLDYLHGQDAMGRQTSHPVLVMEYAEGGTLTDFLKAHPDDAVRDKLIRDIIQGIGYLHGEGILHRDLKPGNILITKNRRGEPVAKITDFGISRDLLTNKTLEQSYTEGVGTPHYMAPEQFYKKRFGFNGELSERTDIWAIGVIAYRMMTGHLPFGGGAKDYEQVREAILEEQPDLSIIPEPYQELIRHCLVKTAADRWAGTKKMLLMLEGKAGDPRSSAPINGDEITTIDQVGDVDLPTELPS